MFDLMKLPAELRIRIYEYALVREIIRVVSTVHPFGALRPSFFDQGQDWYEEPNPEKAMSLRSRSITLANVKYVAGKVVGDEISRSYRIQPDRFPPQVNLFLTSRKVYAETWPIFYQKNAFAFTIPHRVVLSADNCLRFLYDRPYHALRHIRELHLLIGNAPHLPLRFDIGSMVWQRLIDEISRYLSLRTLVLYVRGRTDDARNYHKPDLPWREWLYQMTGLQELHMDIISESTHDQSIAFVKQMRSKMVVGGEQTGTDGFILGQRSMSTLEWTITHPANSLCTSSRYPDMESYCD